MPTLSPPSHHPLSSRLWGIPLVSLETAANVNEGTKLLDAIDAIPPIKQPTGPPRHRPDKLHADKAYDSRDRRAALQQRDITPRIARKGIESKTKLGRHRWVVEMTQPHYPRDAFRPRVRVASACPPLGASW
jgi:hypothetical protein